MKDLFSISETRYTVATLQDDQVILTTKQDVSEIVEANKQQVNAATKKVDSVMTHVARIPNTVIDVLNKMGIMRGFMVTDEKRFKVWLNDPDNRVWRTYPGSV
jgi:ribosomal protein S8